MKVKIRNGAFETNSSSSHSFTIMSVEEKIIKEKKLIEIEKRIEELEEKTKDILTCDMNDYVEKQELKYEASYGIVSFEIKSPLAKLVWLKGLIDNANGEHYKEEKKEKEHQEDYKEISYVQMQNILLKRLKALEGSDEKYLKTKIVNIEKSISGGGEELDNIRSILYDYDPNYDELLIQYPQLVKKIKELMDNQIKEVNNFYNLLKNQYCKIENITEQEADKRVLEEGNKCNSYEEILKDEKNIKSKVKSLLEYNKDFKDFSLSYKDKVKAFKDFVKHEIKKGCKSCKGRISCNRYFREGPLDDCYCGFDSYGAIYSELEIAKKDLSFEEFAKVFITENYSVLGREDWNHCVLITGEVY